MRKIVLEFLPDAADEDEGLGDAGIETYKDAVYAGIAREAGQNSADARYNNPVKMSFDVIKIKSKDFPEYDRFKDTIKVCLNEAIKEKNEKSIDFFKRAKEVLDGVDLDILRVSDFNTKGLVGPGIKGTPFHSLVKGSGVSVKGSDTSGGSFGIGKNAAFAVSELQTVFYSSQYKKGNDPLKFIAQGKSILVSHTDSSGKKRKAKGYWGLEGYKEIDDISLVPQWMRRSDQGTSIFCAGFRYQKGWQYTMAASLLANFFFAIHRGEMEFAVNDGEIVLNSTTVHRYFDDEKIQKAAENNNSLEGFSFARLLFECLTSAHTQEKTIDHPTMGKISFRILVRDGLPKKLAIIRNGMIITDSLEHFGDKFARFNLSKEFIAIVEPKEHDGNALIKKLENPRHDGLSAQRINDPHKRAEAEVAIKKLIKLIRSEIKEATSGASDTEVAIDELTEFFADEANREASHDPEHEDNFESFRYKVVENSPPRKPSRPSKSDRNGSSQAGHQFTNLGKDESKESTFKAATNDDGNNTSDGNDNNSTDKSNRINAVDVDDVRNIMVNEGNRTFRRIYFTPTSSCRLQVLIKATGINDSDVLVPISAHGAKVEDQRLVLDVEEGRRIRVDVELSEQYEGPIELSTFSIQPINEN